MSEPGPSKALQAQADVAALAGAIERAAARSRPHRRSRPTSRSRSSAALRVTDLTLAGAGRRHRRPQDLRASRPPGLPGSHRRVSMLGCTRSSRWMPSGARWPAPAASTATWRREPGARAIARRPASRTRISSTWWACPRRAGPRRPSTSRSEHGFHGGRPPDRRGRRGDARQAQHDRAGARPFRGQPAPRQRRQSTWKAGHISGGSSSGSAPSAAPAGLRRAGLRHRAARSACRRPRCGIVGLKPTYGTREPGRRDGALLGARSPRVR